MTHLAAEYLAGQALTDALDLGVDDRRHLARCGACRTELDELRHVTALGRSLRFEKEMAAPASDVWERISAELEGDLPASERHTVSDLGHEVPPSRAVRPRRRVWALVGVAAAVGLVVGALGAVGILDGRADRGVLVAESALAPLPGRSGAGAVELRDDAGQLRLKVSAEGLPTRGGDLELWLLNVDGKRMQPLGLLTKGQDGTFNVAPWLLEAGYRIVDISLEPRDGDITHSGDSELRGTLPL